MINDFRFFGEGLEVHMKHIHEPTIKQQKILETSCDLQKLQSPRRIMLSP